MAVGNVDNLLSRKKLNVAPTYWFIQIRYSLALTIYFDPYTELCHLPKWEQKKGQCASQGKKDFSDPLLEGMPI